MKKVNTKVLTKISERRNSNVYVSNDKKWLYKFPTTCLENEIDHYKKDIEKTNYILSLGIKTPKIGDIIEDENGNIGLEYEYIKNKISFSRAVSENPDKVDEYMKELAKITKPLHNIKCNNDKIRKITDIIKEDLVIRKDIYNDERIKVINNILNTIEDTDTFLHLDFQPGNYIMSNDDRYIIDLFTICKGNSIYDIGTFYYLYHNISENGTKNLSRCDKNLSEKMWRHFIKHYYNFNGEKEVDVFNEYIKPYAILSAIALDMFIPLEHVQQYIDKNFENIMHKYL